MAHCRTKMLVESTGFTVSTENTVTVLQFIWMLSVLGLWQRCLSKSSGLCQKVQTKSTFPIQTSSYCDKSRNQLSIAHSNQIQQSKVSLEPFKQDSQHNPALTWLSENKAFWLHTITTGVVFGNWNIGYTWIICSKNSEIVLGFIPFV